MDEQSKQSTGRGSTSLSTGEPMECDPTTPGEMEPKLLSPTTLGSEDKPRVFTTIDESSYISNEHPLPIPIEQSSKTNSETPGFQLPGSADECTDYELRDGASTPLLPTPNL